MEHEADIHLMTDRLNTEPVIFLGMCDRELKLASIISILLWVPPALILSITLGFGVIGLGVGLGLAFGMVWLIGQHFRRLKRTKPGNHHLLALRAWLEDKGLVKKTMIRSDEIWDIQRTRRVQKIECLIEKNL